MMERGPVRWIWARPSTDMFPVVPLVPDTFGLLIREVAVRMHRTRANAALILCDESCHRVNWNGTYFMLNTTRIHWSSITDADVIGRHNSRDAGKPPSRCVPSSGKNLPLSKSREQ